MWLPLQLVLEFLGRTAVWLAVMTALGAAVALLATVLARRPLRSAWPRLLLAGLGGAVLGASLADRFGLSDGLAFRVWGRTVPLAWSAGGALLGAAAWEIARRRQARRVAPTSARPPASPTGDGASEPD